MDSLRIGLLLALAFAAVALTVQVKIARSFGARLRFAPPAGHVRAGIRYAFTGALSPRAKESVREHPWAWAVGLAFHLGVFTGALVLLLAWVFRNPSTTERAILGALCAIGSLCGIGLLLKRGLHPELRALSHVDDWVSNLLATALPLAALGWLLDPRLETPLLSTGILLALALPVTKLRHAVFFFLARRALGAFFGYRGSFPVRAVKHHDR